MTDQDPRREWREHKRYMKKWRREQSRHWPTDGDTTVWRLLKEILFGWMKRG